MREDCSPRHVPSEVLAVAEVPRTLSGKVLEVPVKRILMGEDPARAASRDSLANPAALDWFVELARAARGARRRRAASRWRTSRRATWRGWSPACGCSGRGRGCVVASELGNSPWTVLAEGVSLNTPLAIGAATIAISGAVLLAWLPLRQRPGLGTVLNAIVDRHRDRRDARRRRRDDLPLAVRWLVMLGGIALVAVGSGLYLGAALGPGPRDGLMTGLHRVTGRPVGARADGDRADRADGGWLLGGTVGIGTIRCSRCRSGPPSRSRCGTCRRSRPHEL